MEDAVVVAEGALLRLKEMLRALAQVGVAAQLLPPADNCRTG